MGSFLVNLHLRTADRKSLQRELEDRGCQAWVTDAQQGWTTLYESRASEQDENWIRELGSELTRSLQTSGIAFLVHDSDIFCYWLFENGELADHFNSCPDYFSETEIGAGPLIEDPARLLKYCKPGTTREDVEAILTEGTVFAEDLLEKLAGLLDLDPARVHCDFRDFEEDPPEDFPAVFVGTKSPRGRASSRSFLQLHSEDVEEGDDGTCGGPQGRS